MASIKRFGLTMDELEAVYSGLGILIEEDSTRIVADDVPPHEHDHLEQRLLTSRDLRQRLSFYVLDQPAAAVA